MERGDRSKSRRSLAGGLGPRNAVYSARRYSSSVTGGRELFRAALQQFIDCSDESVRIKAMVFGHGNQGWPVELSVDHLSGINLSPHIWSIEYLLKKS